METTMQRLATGFGLIEAPWWETDGSLLFTDTMDGGAHRLRPDGSVEVVLPHRKGMGGLVPHVEGGYVVSGRNVSYKTPEQTLVLFDAPADGYSFNDLSAGPDGRVYVGSVGFDPLGGDAEPPPGGLYLIDLDGSVHQMSDDVKVTNGIGISPDHRLLYHADTMRGVLWRFRRAADGRLSERRVLAEVEGGPDGLAVAEDGSIWIALSEGGCVVVLEPDGSERDRLVMEVPMVTSVCFGGEDRRDLYVVTGSLDAPGELRGGVYRTRVDVPGVPVHRARVSIPG